MPVAWKDITHSHGFYRSKELSTISSALVDYLVLVIKGKNYPNQFYCIFYLISAFMVTAQKDQGGLFPECNEIGWDSFFPLLTWPNSPPES
jgi:hypothetical protein